MNRTNHKQPAHAVCAYPHRACHTGNLLKMWGYLSRPAGSSSGKPKGFLRSNESVHVKNTAPFPIKHSAACCIGWNLGPFCLFFAPKWHLQSLIGAPFAHNMISKKDTRQSLQCCVTYMGDLFVSLNRWTVRAQCSSAFRRDPDGKLKAAATGSSGLNNDMAAAFRDLANIQEARGVFPLPLGFVLLSLTLDYSSSAITVSISVRAFVPQRA